MMTPRRGQLGVSPRTIEVRRAQLLEKPGARNAIELVRMLLGEGRGA